MGYGSLATANPGTAVVKSVKYGIKWRLVGLLNGSIDGDEDP